MLSLRLQLQSGAQAVRIERVLDLGQDPRQRIGFGLEAADGDRALGIEIGAAEGEGEVELRLGAIGAAALGLGGFARLGRAVIDPAQALGRAIAAGANADGFAPARVLIVPARLDAGIGAARELAKGVAIAAGPGERDVGQRGARGRAASIVVLEARAIFGRRAAFDLVDPALDQIGDLLRVAAAQAVEVEIADTGAPTGVPPRRLDAPDPLPHRQSRQVLHQMRL